jgi:hypothetical protein
MMLVMLLLAGCGRQDGVPPGVEAGRFTAQVQGSVSDSLRGEAVYRMEDGRLTGVELSVDSTRGISVDVEPRRQARGVYEIVDWELMGVDRGDEPSGAVAFLELPRGQFHAVAGTLTVSYATSSEVSGSFVFRMEGSLDGVPGDAPSVSTTGSFRATRQ